MKFLTISLILIGSLTPLTLTAFAAADETPAAPTNCGSLKTTEAATAKLEEDVFKQSPLKIQQCIKEVRALENACPPTDDLCKTTKTEIIDILESGLLALSTRESTQALAETVGFPIDAAAGDSCIEDDDKDKIWVIVQEGLEEEIPEGQSNIRNCIRNTYCVERETSAGLECITYDTQEQHCSGLPIEYKDFDGVQFPTLGDKRVSISCKPIQVYFGESGIDLLYTYIGSIYRWAASVVGIIAVLVLVISGIQISAAAGDQQALTSAKTRIFQSLSGLAILFLSAIILYTINPTFFVN